MREKPIGVVIENPAEHIGKLCHIAGFPTGCVFRLQKTDGKEHVLITPKSGRVYKVKRPLLYTRKQMENMAPQ